MKKRTHGILSLLLTAALMLSLLLGGALAEEIASDEPDVLIPEIIEETAEDAAALTEASEPDEDVLPEAEADAEIAVEEESEIPSEEALEGADVSTETSADAESQFTYTDLNESYHLFSDTVSGYQRLEYHNDYDENQDKHTGVCVYCGHVINDETTACSHPSTQTSEYAEWDDLTVTASNSEGHTCVYTNLKVYSVTYCNVCGEELSVSIEYDSAKETFQEEHAFLNSDTCEICGYKNTCKHENQYYLWSYADSYYTSVDENNHVLAAWWYYLSFCEDCGAVFIENFDDNDIAAGEFYEVLEVNTEDNSIWATVLEEHDFDVYGYCGCGFYGGNPAPVEEDDISYIDVGSDKYHLWVNNTLNFQYLESHSTYDWETDTYADHCVYCGHVLPTEDAPCEHENTYTWYDILSYETVQSTSLNAKEHTVTFVNVEMDQYTECEICGKTLSKERVKQDTYSVTENHYYYDDEHNVSTNVCQECGYVNTCTHPNLQYSWDSGDFAPFYRIVDDENHIALADYFYYAYCDICDYYAAVPFTEEDIANAGFLEYSDVDEVNHSVWGAKVLPHSFDEDGYCWCGFHRDVVPEPDYTVNLDGITIGESVSAGKGLLTIADTVQTDEKLYARVTWAYELSDGTTFAYCAMREIDENNTFEADSPIAPFGATLANVQVAIVTDPNADMSGIYNALALGRK